MVALTQTTLPVKLPDFPITAKPFLKWAGGKGQLIGKMSAFFPPELVAGKINRYIEPFIGGGAIFFHIAQSYPVNEFYISDLNAELILLYRTIREDVNRLIDLLSQIERQYFRFEVNEQKNFFYKMRTEFNAHRQQINFVDFQPEWIALAAQIVFLNRTCFNGLFRVNSKGEFNVPFGDYKNPKICDGENLRAVSQILQRTIIRHADFTACDEFVDSKSFVYFDPPYRPISKTASFTSYSQYNFGEDAQARLADFYTRLNAKGAKLMLSNSDPKNEMPQDNFFDELYGGFHVNRVSATRMINCDASKRGPIAELLITNYSTKETSKKAVKKNGRS